MKVTKKQQVLNHLLENGSITSWEAILRYKATRLSGIIYDLKKRGYPIVSTLEIGEDTHYTRYYLQNAEQ